MAKPLIKLELDMSAIYFARPADWSSRLVVLRQLTYLSRGCVVNLVPHYHSADLNARVDCVVSCMRTNIRGDPE